MNSKSYILYNIKARLGKKIVTIAGFGLKNHVFACCTALAIVSKVTVASSYDLQQLVLSR